MEGKKKNKIFLNFVILILEFSHTFFFYFKLCMGLNMIIFLAFHLKPVKVFI